MCPGEALGSHGAHRPFSPSQNGFFFGTTRAFSGMEPILPSPHPTGLFRPTSSPHARALLSQGMLRGASGLIYPQGYPSPAESIDGGAVQWEQVPPQHPLCQRQGLGWHPLCSTRAPAPRGAQVPLGSPRPLCGRASDAGAVTTISVLISDLSALQTRTDTAQLQQGTRIVPLERSPEIRAALPGSGDGTRQPWGGNREQRESS